MRAIKAGRIDDATFFFRLCLRTLTYHAFKALFVNRPLRDAVRHRLLPPNTHWMGQRFPLPDNG